MIAYFLNIILFSFCFWLLYKIFFAKETFFELNRVYLIVVPVLIVILPFISLNIFESMVESDTTFLSATNLNELVLSSAESSAGELNSTGFQLSIFYIVFGIYFLGVAYKLVVFGRKIVHLQQLKTSGEKRSFQKIDYIQLSDSQEAFTFFNEIYVGDQFSTDTLNMILKHEQIHRKQKHSIDILFYELLKIVCWFNPFFYFLQHEIKEVHEFLADQKTAENNKTEYAQTILNTVFETTHFSMTNSFFINNSTKKRIMMLHKNQSKPKSLLRYFTIIPLVFGMLFYVSCAEDRDDQREDDTEQIMDENDSKTKNAIEETETTESVPFDAVDVLPAFPDRERDGDKEINKQNFNQDVQEFIGENFNKDVLEDVSSEMIRIYAQFQINPEGEVKIIKVRTDEKVLEKETTRVLNKLPTMQPGEADGEKVTISYTLPISFKNSAD